MAVSNPKAKKWHFYVRQQKVYIPRVALTDAGFFWDIEPVAVSQLDDDESLTKAVVATLEAGNPEVRAPSRAEYGEPVVSKAAGTGSWSRFEKGARCHVVYWDEGGFRIPKMKAASDGGWVESNVVQKLPSSSTPVEVARELVKTVRESMAAGSSRGKRHRK